MPLDTDIAALLNQNRDRPPPAGVQGLRDMLELQAKMLPRRSTTTQVPVTVQIPSPSGGLEARIYRPANVTRPRLTVFFHGGGYSAGSLDTHDAACAELAQSAQTAVLSVAYRLAPEHGFPASADDAHTAVTWANAHSDVLGVADGKLAIAGDSAGANLAIAAARRFLGSEQNALQALLLFYPPTDHIGDDYVSRRDNAVGFGLTEAARQMLVGLYAPTVEIRADPEISPIFADDLGSLPPTLIVTAEFDILRDEGLRFAEMLAAAGARVDSWTAEGMVHGFINYTGASPAAGKYFDRAGAWLGEQFKT
ncbi:alpha/beta hydrolase [soil metagenome]